MFRTRNGDCLLTAGVAKTEDEITIGTLRFLATIYIR